MMHEFGYKRGWLSRAESWFLALVPILILASGCTRKEVQQVRIDHHDWVATVGTDTIDVTEFKQRFQTSAVVGEGIGARVDFLKALVLERMLRQYALENRLDTTRYTKRLLAEMDDEALVEAYLAREVDQRVHVDEANMRRDFLRIIRTLTLDAWAFTDSMDAVDALHRITQGIEFDKISTPDKRNGSRVYLENQELRYGQADPEFEDAAYSLKLGDISEPFFSDGRWWLLKLMRFKQERIPSEAAFASYAPSLRSTLLRRHRGPEQKKLIEELMHGKQMRLDRDSFRWLVDRLGSRLPKNENTIGTPPKLLTLPDPSMELPTGNIADSSILDRPLLTITGPGGWKWTTREVVERLATLPIPIVQRPGRSAEKSIGDALVWMSEFETLARTARKAGLEKDTTVVRNREMWRENALSVQGWFALEKSEWNPTSKKDTIATDSTRLNWFILQTEKTPVRFNLRRLQELSLNSTPAIVRKTHFPNRLATPYPVAYEIALKWDPR